MNGRCETDPFDQAINVCGLCYGEFCQTCLVAVKGRRHPLCKDCAIVSAGLRAGAKPIIRGSRKTAKARRIELAEAPPQAGFEYFDVQPLDPEATASDVVDALRAASDTYSETGALADDNASQENGGAKQKRKRRPKKGQGEAVSPAAKKAAKKASKKAAKATSKALAEDASKDRGKADEGQVKADGGHGKADAPATTDAGPTSPSAVNQLDQIRGTSDDADGTDNEVDTGEQTSFRKPRPFIKSPDEDPAATPAAAGTKGARTAAARTTSTERPASTRSAQSTKRPAATRSDSKPNSGSRSGSNTLPKRRGGATSAPSATGDGLPRRRAKPDSADVTARAENTEAAKSASGDLPRRRSRGKGTSTNGSGSRKPRTTDATAVPPALQKPEPKQGADSKPAGKKAPAPTHRSGQQAAPVKDRRRPKEPGDGVKAKAQTSATTSDQAAPPAWTQKARKGTKAEAETQDKGAKSATLPKRRRKG